MARSRLSSSESLYYYRHRTRSRLVGFLRFVIVFYILYELITSMVIASYSVSSITMSPLVSPGDRVLVAPLVYGARVPYTQIRLPAFHRPRRGDIVLLRPPYARRDPWYVRIIDPVVGFFTGRSAGLGSQYHPAVGSPLTIARVVGVPGDTIELRDGVAFVKPAGASAFSREQALAGSSYRVTPPSLPRGWDAKLPFSGTMRAETLAPGEYFVIGDDRSAANGSALWGPISSRRILGQVVFRYWPLSKLGAL